MKLVPDWKLMWRSWSVRLNAIGLAVMSLIWFDPSIALMLLNAMPSGVRAILPANAVTLASVLIYGAAILARIVHQPKLEEKRRAATQSD